MKQKCWEVEVFEGPLFCCYLEKKPYYNICRSSYNAAVINVNNSVVICT